MIIFNLNLDINNISNVSDFIYIQLGNNRLIYLKRNFKKGIAKKKSAYYIKKVAERIGCK